MNMLQSVVITAATSMQTQTQTQLKSQLPLDINPRAIYKINSRISTTSSVDAGAQHQRQRQRQRPLATQTDCEAGQEEHNLFAIK